MFAKNRKRLNRVIFKIPIFAYEKTAANKNLFKNDDKKPPEMLQLMLFGCLYN